MTVTRFEFEDLRVVKSHDKKCCRRVEKDLFSRVRASFRKALHKEVSLWKRFFLTHLERSPLHSPVVHYL